MGAFGGIFMDRGGEWGIIGRSYGKNWVLALRGLGAWGNVL